MTILLCAIGSSAILAASAVASSASVSVMDAQDGRREAQAARGDRPPRAGRQLPPPPDWPRAGGFGPEGGAGLAIEAIVAGGEFGGRALTDEDVERAVAVAHAVSPEWGSVIEARAKRDPEQMRAALRTGARRLLALAALRERAPAVYEAKIVELRAQAETARASSALRAAEVDPSASAEDRMRAVAELDGAARRQVEATLAVREAELAALEAVIERMRAELAVDRERVAELAADMASRARPRGGDGAGDGAGDSAGTEGPASDDDRGVP
ncbi:MAG: hypothetical protein GC172_10400 [Phycisphaera sp.]|nr:hypothetical protein [Phycisphaera sp.]